MERKITIRRVGTIFPALCLVVIVLVSFVITWLSIVGLPDVVLRKIEHRAAQYGVTLHLPELKLAPYSGLAVKADKVRLSAPVGSELAELYLKKIQVSFSFFELLKGNYNPVSIHLMGMNARVPDGEKKGHAIHLQDSDTRIAYFNKGNGMRIDSSANIQGIRFNFKSTFRFPQTQLQPEISPSTGSSVSSTTEPLNLDAILSPIQPWLRKAETIIEEQHWQTNEYPELDVNIRYREERIAAEIKAKVPSFKHEDLHFQNASMTFRFEDETLTIDHLTFATKSPRTEVSLQGAYYIPERQLSFNLRSSAALVQIAEMIDPTLKESILSRIYPDSSKTPTIKLIGQIEFSEDYAFNNIALRGSILQREFCIGQTPINSFALSFILADSRFNIDNLSLTLPDGQIKVTALNGLNQSDAQINISVPINTLTQLISDLTNEPLPFPESLKPGGRLTLNASALLGVKEFCSGSTRISDLIPTLKEVQYLDLALDSLQYGEITLTEPKLHFKTAVTKIPNRLSDILDIKNLFCQLSAKQLNIRDDYSFRDSLISLTVDSLTTHCSAPIDALKITGANAEMSIGSSALGDLSAHNISFKINNISSFDFHKKWAEVLTESGINAYSENISYQNRELTPELHLTVRHPKMHNAEFLLQSNAQDKEIAVRLNLNYEETAQNGNLHFELPETCLSLIEAAPLFQQFGMLPDSIELPEKLIFSAKGNVNVKTGQVYHSDLYLHTPELVRTPKTLTINKDKKIPLSLTLRAALESNTNAEILYQGDVDIQHKSGSFQAKIDGNIFRYCNISQGHNSIDINTLDAIIDDSDAHSIMRDFRFNQESQVTISDISARVEYDNGISVKSFCKADIRNTDFLIGAIEDIRDARGNITGERLRTDMGSNPYSRVFKATCDVLVDVRMDQKNADGSPAPEKLQVTLNSPYLDYDNRPWLKQQHIRKGARSSVIRGDSIVFDLDNNGIVLNNLKGKAYPAYAFGMFFAPLREYMSDIRLQNPVDVRTKRCEFPISGNSKVPISGLILAESANGAAFDFLGTTIPLQRFSGFVNLSDDFVFLDKMNARTWGGVLNGAIKIGISGKNTSFDGQLNAQNLDLKLIGDAYKTKLSPALCNASIRFKSPTPEITDVQAYGSVSIRDGNLMELGIFKPVGSLISDLPDQLASLQRKVTGKDPSPVEEDKPGLISRFLSAFTRTTDSAVNKVDESSRHIPFANHFMSYNIQNATLNFDILNGYLYTRDMKASGYNLDVDMNLRLNLNTLDLRGNLWPQISSVPTLIIAPITFLSDFLIDIVIYGNVENIQWKFTLDKIMQKDRQQKTSVKAAEETPTR